ncbi:hypothetical protein AA101099_0397 [Neoasaia chiangmaiensis NBRC 101099]|uniref:Uncharacterized protein n=1 Tax=Neoasaia chiangmaiensis TaxID=320497 RepID=A0A1U9KRQ0_9PROT|nr:hypothetical protein A0U93_11685 [Neoasaia chiangmaiensis]GBR36542.1 hypothetical protein AA101099_0397 [Neoasaia chiangmaiensis NBRC 101099]GEN15308.1 hypothetical protein NCH01_17390 [Neoasaia chiangmaiensis]
MSLLSHKLNHARKIQQGALRRELTTELGRWTIEIVKRGDRAEGFVALPNRWIVERNLRMARTLPPPHEGCRGNNPAIPRLVDDRQTAF